MRNRPLCGLLFRRHSILGRHRDSTGVAQTSFAWRRAGLEVASLDRPALPAYSGLSKAWRTQTSFMAAHQNVGDCVRVESTICEPEKMLGSLGRVRNGAK